MSPVRGPRGARLYSDADIQYLALLARAVEGGRAIGDVARLGREQLASLLAPASAPDNKSEAPSVVGQRDEIRSLLDALSRLDGQEVRRLLGERLVALGVTQLIFSIVGPLLIEVGERWRRGELSVAAEHLCSAVVKDMIGALGYMRHSPTRPTLVLATMSGEHHDIGLALVDLLAGYRGLPTLRLGSDLPVEEVLNAVRATRPRVLGVSAVASPNRDATTEALATLLRELPAATDLWLGGADAEAIAHSLRSPRLTLVNDRRTLEHHLDLLARAGSSAGSAPERRP